MIAKKNPKLNLEGKRLMFFQLGLLVTGSLTLAAFTFTDVTPRLTSQVDYRTEQGSLDFELVKPEPIKEEEILKKPEIDRQEPQVVSPQQVTQDIKIITSTTKIPEPGAISDLNGLKTGLTMIAGPGKVDIDIPAFEFVDVDASFIGGYGEMQRFIGKNVIYPQISMEYNEEGVVNVSFIVEKDGSISTVKIVTGVSKSLDKEAIRVVKLFPKWKAGEINLQLVRTIVRLPIRFEIAG
jgi:protein TonB